MVIVISSSIFGFLSSQNLLYKFSNNYSPLEKYFLDDFVQIEIIWVVDMCKADILEKLFIFVPFFAY